MAKKQEFKTIRKSTQRMLDKSEGRDVDFKRTFKKIDSEEFVAFANSLEGGVLLLGVDETIDNQGKQRGQLVGCKVSDEAKRIILDKALNCVPPIDVFITVENTNHNPFFRIDIPSGKHKPYCTSSGKYTIREDGRKRPLMPNELLEIFLREQQYQFASKFQEAAEPLLRNIGVNNENLQNNISAILDAVLRRFIGVERVPEQIEQSEKRLFSSLLEIEYLIESNEEILNDIKSSTNDIVGETNDIKNRVPDLHQDVYHLSWKLNAILDHLKIEDPEITRERDKVRSMAEVSFIMFAKTRDLSEVESIYEETKKRMNESGLIKLAYEECVSLEDAIEWFNVGLQQESN